MAERPLNMVLKQVLELGPTIVFFLIYLRIKERHFTILGTDYSGFIVATLIFVPILLASMAVLWWLTGTLSRMQMFTAFMVIFFGGFSGLLIHRFTIILVIGVIISMISFIDDLDTIGKSRIKIPPIARLIMQI